MNIANLDYYQSLSEERKIFGGVQDGITAAQEVIDPSTGQIVGTSTTSASSTATGPKSQVAVSAFVITGYNRGTFFNRGAYFSDSASTASASVGD